MKKETTLSKSLSWAFFLNLLFAIIELIGGYLTNSTAIITDAFHDFMDAAAIGAALIMDRFSKKPASATYHFGYRRFALLSALALSAILLVGAAFMMYHAIQTFGIKKEVNSLGMLGLAILGIVINGFAFFKIKKGDAPHNHSHAHAHSHDATDANSKAIMLHLLEDVMGWVAVLVGAIVMYFTQWYWIDPLLTLLIGLFIAYNAVTNLWNTFKILLQAAPQTINVNALSKDITEITGVNETVSVKLWSNDGVENIANIQVKINDLEHYPIVRTKIKALLKNEYHINDSTIEII